MSQISQIYCNHGSLVSVRRCPVCECIDFQPLYIDQSGQRLSECKTCGHVFMEIRKAQAVLADLLYRKNDDAITANIGAAQRDRRLHEYFLSLLKKENAQGVALDVGCGNGFFVKMLCDYGYRAKGIELNTAQYKIGNEKLGVEIINTAIEDFNSQEKYDIIATLHNLEHLVDPNAAVSKYYDLLNPGGILLVNVPSFDNPRWIINRLWGGISDLRDYWPEQHLQYFKVKTLSRLLTNSNFDIIHSETAMYRYKYLRGNSSLARVLFPVVFLIDSLLNVLGIGGILVIGKKT